MAEATSEVQTEEFENIVRRAESAITYLKAYSRRHLFNNKKTLVRKLARQKAITVRKYDN